MKLAFSILPYGSHDRSRWESIAIWLFIGIACPYLTFIAFWWSTAVFHFYVFPLPDSGIATMAFVGLAIGCLLDVIFLRRWVEKFYTVSLRRMFVFYCGCFVVGFATFMGFPIGTFALGILAGIYVGRREHHRQASQRQLKTTLNRTALLTSSFTTLATLPIGILGLREPMVGSLVEKYFGLDRNGLGGTWGFLLVGVLCLSLFAGQFACTEIAGRLAFRITSGRASQIP